VLRRPGLFKMGPLEIAAFEDLQQCLSTDPVLIIPDGSAQTDASDLGVSSVSAILIQCDLDGKEQGVIQYASRIITKDEFKWHAQEKEALAIVWSCWTILSE
jgi:hypothetical protein